MDHRHWLHKREVVQASKAGPGSCEFAEPEVAVRRVPIHNEPLGNSSIQIQLGAQLFVQQSEALLTTCYAAMFVSAVMRPVQLPCLVLGQHLGLVKVLHDPWVVPQQRWARGDLVGGLTDAEPRDDVLPHLQSRVIPQKIRVQRLLILKADAYIQLIVVDRAEDRSIEPQQGQLGIQILQEDLPDLVFAWRLHVQSPPGAFTV
mmetsp:Transcript_82775/g.208387  ORF Transcript_82775/g.208387 Transcript_82775/m.208387 type:complete len:203 (-) Transcript_82775:968-1576(-)